MLLEGARCHTEPFGSPKLWIREQEKMGLINQSEHSYLNHLPPHPYISKSLRNVMQLSQ